MDDRYLQAGIGAMATAGEPFMAHFGAALLAAWWLDDDVGLTPEASTAMTQQADAMMAKHAWLFVQPPRSDSRGRGTELLQALSGSLSHTWAVGHDVIYTALVLRTFTLRPELSQNWIVDQLIEIITACRRFPLESIASVFDVRGVSADEVDEGESATPMRLARLAVRTMLSFKHVYVGLHQGDIGHIPDHAHALLTLDRLGFHEIAEEGLNGFREHVAAARRVVDRTAQLQEVRDVQPFDPREVEYWEQGSEVNDWAIGHLFKYPYALIDLIHLADDARLHSLALRRLGELVSPE